MTQLLAHVLNANVSCLFCRWHDDFNAFKAGVRDLEVMLSNVIQLAFDVCPCLTARSELLEAFQLMAQREAVSAHIVYIAAGQP